MALRASDGGVHSGQRVVSVQRVIELGVEPVGCRVASPAVLGQAELRVRRVVGGVVVGAVAGIAGGRRSGENIVNVACGAGQSGMHPGQREPGEFEVVEAGAEPTVHGVAALAGGGEAQGNVVDDRRLEVLPMAGVAGGRQSLELPGRGILVALVALRQGVRPYQRKAVLVIANRILRDIPAADRVATFAIGAELAAVNIRVAIGATLADVLEDEAGMALGAAHLLVHAAQWIARLVVIELRNGPDGLPTGVGVAILAGNGQRTMRVGHLGLWTSNAWPRVVLWLLRRHAEQQREQYNAETREPASPVHLLLHAPFAALPAGFIPAPNACRVPPTSVPINNRS